MDIACVCIDRGVFALQYELHTVTNHVFICSMHALHLRHDKGVSFHKVKLHTEGPRAGKPAD
jgi:hypothetical protein